MQAKLVPVKFRLKNSSGVITIQAEFSISFFDTMTNQTNSMEQMKKGYCPFTENIVITAGRITYQERAIPIPTI